MGKVYLVGAGPGDPGLITVKGLRCLEEAQAVVYDRLVNPSLVDLAPAEAERTLVGKGPRDKEWSQARINQLLVELASQGKRVVRLKGGDPFVFGRGGEEAEALAKAGVPFEVVPGVTSAIAVPAYAGIPLTHRAISSSFAVVTGREDPQRRGSRVKWERLARAVNTLVVLMGMESLEKNVTGLLKGGLEPSTPVALIRWGTTQEQDTLEGTLGDIVEQAGRKTFGPPVVAVIGEVVKLRNSLAWFEARPLFGKRVLVTRSRHQSSVLARLLVQEGAQPVEVPTIEVKPLEDYSQVDGLLGHLDGYSWVIFTSTNAVDTVWSRLRALRKDARAFGRSKVAAIGSSTQEALEQRGVHPDLVPAKYLTSSILEELRKDPWQGQRVLLPRADIAGEELAQGLSALGAHVDDVAIYHTVQPSEGQARLRHLLSDKMVDVVTFTSSSTVRNLVSMLEEDPGPLNDTVVACIGPVTARAARELGIKVSLTAKEHTVPGLVASLKDYLSGQKGAA